MHCDPLSNCKYFPIKISFPVKYVPSFINPNLSSDYKRAQHHIENPGVYLMQYSSKNNTLPFFYISESMAQQVLKIKNIKTLKRRIEKKGKTKTKLGASQMSLTTENNEKHLFYPH